MRNINTRILVDTINEIKDEQLEEELQKWLKDGAPKYVADAWLRYIEKMEDHEKRKMQVREEIAKQQQEVAKYTQVIAMCIFVGVVIFCIYQVSELFTLQNNVHEAARCIR